MRRGRGVGFTLVELLVVVGIIGLLAAILVPTVQAAMEIARQTACLTNLRSVGMGLALYTKQNEHQWPWIANVRSDWSKVPTGANRDRDPSRAPEDPGDRSITALVFLLVRDRQPAKLFICPSDQQASVDQKVTWDHDGDDQTPPAFYWDFAAAEHVSYSWQAPVLKAPAGGTKGDRPEGKPSGAAYVNGIRDDDPEAVIMADKTPLAVDPAWSPLPMEERMDRQDIRRNMSRNHAGGDVISVLRADMGVFHARRPDVGAHGDNIYTASGRKSYGAREATGLDIARHLSSADSFLIGPIGE